MPRKGSKGGRSGSKKKQTGPVVARRPRRAAANAARFAMQPVPSDLQKMQADQLKDAFGTAAATLNHRSEAGDVLGSDSDSDSDTGAEIQDQHKNIGSSPVNEGGPDNVESESDGDDVELRPGVKRSRSRISRSDIELSDDEEQLEPEEQPQLAEEPPKKRRRAPVRRNLKSTVTMSDLEFSDDEEEEMEPVPKNSFLLRRNMQPRPPTVPIDLSDDEDELPERRRVPTKSKSPARGRRRSLLASELRRRSTSSPAVPKTPDMRVKLQSHGKVKTPVKTVDNLVAKGVAPHLHNAANRLFTSCRSDYGSPRRVALPVVTHKLTGALVTVKDSFEFKLSRTGAEQLAKKVGRSTARTYEQEAGSFARDAVAHRVEALKYLNDVKELKDMLPDCGDESTQLHRKVVRKIDKRRQQLKQSMLDYEKARRKCFVKLGDREKKAKPAVMDAATHLINFAAEVEARGFTPDQRSALMQAQFGTVVPYPLNGARKFYQAIEAILFQQGGGIFHSEHGPVVRAAGFQPWTASGVTDTATDVDDDALMKSLLDFSASCTEQANAQTRSAAALEFDPVEDLDRDNDGRARDSDHDDEPEEEPQSESED